MTPQPPPPPPRPNVVTPLTPPVSISGYLVIARCNHDCEEFPPLATCSPVLRNAWTSSVWDFGVGGGGGGGRERKEGGGVRILWGPVVIHDTCGKVAWPALANYARSAKSGVEQSKASRHRVSVNGQELIFTTRLKLYQLVHMQPVA